MSDHSFAYKPRRRSEKRGADNLSDSARKEQEPPITQASGHSAHESTNDKHVVPTQPIAYDVDNPYESGIKGIPICDLPAKYVPYGTFARCPVCGQWWMKELGSSLGSWYWRHMGPLRMHLLHRDIIKHQKSQEES